MVSWEPLRQYHHFSNPVVMTKPALFHPGSPQYFGTFMFLPQSACKLPRACTQLRTLRSRTSCSVSVGGNLISILAQKSNLGENIILAGKNWTVDRDRGGIYGQTLHGVWRGVSPFIIITGTLYIVHKTWRVEWKSVFENYNNNGLMFLFICSCSYSNIFQGLVWFWIFTPTSIIGMEVSILGNSR